MFICDARVTADSESSLINAARRAISESSWEVGKAAATWVRRWARGRTDGDFGCMIGVSADQVYQRRRVYEDFADVRENYHRLMWAHFYAALNWGDAAECLKWANDLDAGVAEMKAWRRANLGAEIDAE